MPGFLANRDVSPIGSSNPYAGVAQGIANVGSAAINYASSADTNKTNIDIANATNAFNADQAQQNREFQTNMSNTAIQRQVMDMRLAGLNPILAAGGGASTPSGGQASGVQAKVENPWKGVADAVGSTIPNALQAMNAAKDLDSKDAQIQATKAGALASVAQAANSNASAKATEAQMPVYEGRAKTAGVEAEARASDSAATKAQRDLDAKNAQYDSYTKRIVEGAGAASSAVGVGNQLKKLITPWSGGSGGDAAPNPFRDLWNKTNNAPASQ